MEDLKKPLLTAGLFFAVAKAWSVSKGTEVPLSSQLVVSGMLAASTWAAEQSQAEKNPAVKALTAGSLFAGAMYVGLGSDRLLTHAVLGTLTAYAAEVVLPEKEKREEENKDEFRFD
jgi:hypothetical protein